MKNSINYWYRLEEGTKNTLLNDIYLAIKSNNSWWVRGIHDIIRHYGLGDLIYKKPHKNTAKIVQQRMKDCYIQEWFSKIESSVKLGHLCTLKKQYTRSIYLNKIKNINYRQQITKLRLSAHKRGFGTINNEQITNCELCNTNANLKHYILYCGKFNQKRYSIINSLHMHDISNEQLLHKLLNVEFCDKNIGKCIDYLLYICNQLAI